MARTKGSGNWTKQQKAEAVAILHNEAGGCFSEAERITDMCKDTIAQASRNPEILEIVDVKKRDLGRQFNSLLIKLLAKYETQVENADLSNKGTTLLGIVADKALLYNDEPNQITANADVSRQLELLRERGYSEADAQLIVAEAQKRIGEWVN